MLRSWLWREGWIIGRLRYKSGGPESWMETTPVSVRKPVVAAAERHGATDCRHKDNRMGLHYNSATLILLDWFGN